jgi:hypothetical protein
MSPHIFVQVSKESDLPRQVGSSIFNAITSIRNRIERYCERKRWSGRVIAPFGLAGVGCDRQTRAHQKAGYANRLGRGRS